MRRFVSSENLVKELTGIREGDFPMSETTAEVMEMETTAEERDLWRRTRQEDEYPDSTFHKLLRDFDRQGAEIVRLRNMLRIDGEQHAAAVNAARHEQDERLKVYKAELEKCGNDRAQDQHRLFHVEGIIEDQWRAGEEAVLAFIRNGRFLSDSAPIAQFAREVEAGWKLWGKAEADKKRRAEIDEAVATRAARVQSFVDRSALPENDDHE